jgi:pimeloyl-ACP methyl ester carboxylesterase
VRCLETPIAMQSEGDAMIDDETRRVAAAPAPRPSLALLGTETLRASWEAMRHLTAAQRAGLRGDGHTVILFPGLCSDARALWALKRHLNRHGMRAIDWGRGWNTGPSGDVDLWLASLTHSVFARADVGPSERVSMVGWSLGGFYAREIAKLAPQRVRRVVTIGTPFNAAQGATNVGWLYRLVNREAGDATHLNERLSAPPPVATTSIYSRRDGVVAWQACVHSGQHAQVREIEVEGSHLGMGWNSAVLDLVSQELMRPPFPRPRSNV